MFLFRYNYIVVAAMFCTLLLGSCDVTTVTPKDRISSDAAFSTPEKIEAAVIGVYDGLQQPNFLAGRSLVYSEVLAENVVAKSYFNSLYNGTMLANHAFPQNEWTAGYNAIARANRTIEGIENNRAIAGSNANAYIGECKFVRALAHFILVNHFAQPYVFTAGATHLGIPVETVAYEANAPEALKPRNTVAEVYIQIIADLKEAELNLLSGFTNSNYDKIRATSIVASALLSRVYLYQGNYEQAKIAAEKVINAQKFDLNSAPGDCFRTDNFRSAETIFSIPNTAADNPGAEFALAMTYRPTATGRGDLLVSLTFLQLTGFAADDKRRGLLTTQTVSGVTQTYCNKFTSVTSKLDWAPIIRYPEILLTAAEAAVRSSGQITETDLARLNKVRDRSRLTASQYSMADFTSATAFVEKVLLERNIELAFEGHRMHDILRVKSDITGKRADDYSLLPAVAFGSDYTIMPIPDAEIVKNKLLVQNHGY